MTSVIASALKGVVGVGVGLALGCCWRGCWQGWNSGTRFAKQDQHVQRSEGRDGSVVVWVVSGER